MLITITLTVIMMLLLFLMIWSATLTLPYKGLAKNFPEDVQERLKPRLDGLPMSGKRIFGIVLLIIIFLLMIADFVYGGIDGLHHGYTFRQFLLRFLIIGYGVKAFDIIALDYFLLTQTHFFQHYFPETDGCEGWKQFGYNRKQQLKQLIVIPVFCLITALIFSML